MNNFLKINTTLNRIFENLISVIGAEDDGRKQPKGYTAPADR